MQLATVISCRRQLVGSCWDYRKKMFREESSSRTPCECDHFTHLRFAIDEKRRKVESAKAKSFPVDDEKAPADAGPFVRYRFLFFLGN